MLQIAATLERRGAVASLSLTVAIETAGSRGGDHVRQPSQPAPRSASASAPATPARSAETGDGGPTRTGSARKAHKLHLDHRMQPDLGVGNLSVISGAKRRDSEASIVHPCHRLSKDAYRQVKGQLDLAVSDLGPKQLKNTPTRSGSIPRRSAQRWPQIQRGPATRASGDASASPSPSFGPGRLTATRKGTASCGSTSGP